MKRTQIQVIGAPERAWSCKYMIVAPMGRNYIYCDCTNDETESIELSIKHHGKAYEINNCEPNYEYEEEW